MEIKLIDIDKKRFLALLLEGDEQESMIDRYLGRGDMFVMYDGDMPVAVAVVTKEKRGVCELKNIAVDRSYRRCGLGKNMVEYLCSLFGSDCHTMLVGTGDSFATTVFYRNCGFVYSHTVADFFVDNYDHPIIEDGRQLRDMIYFKRNL